MHSCFIALAVPVIATASLQGDWLCTDTSFSGLCQLVPKGPDGYPVYNNGSIPNAPWVVGRSDKVVIPGGGAVAPGAVPGFPHPIVFVVENGELAFEGDSTSTEITTNAIFVACDAGVISLKGPVTVRLNQTKPQYLPWVFSDRSHFEIKGPSVQVYPNSAELGPSVQGQWLTVASQSSTLLAVDGPTFPRMFKDSWELASVGKAHTQLVRSGPFLCETYVQGEAYLGYENSSYFDIFFELCSPGAGVLATNQLHRAGSSRAAPHWQPILGEEEHGSLRSMRSLRRGDLQPGLMQLQRLLDAGSNGGQSPRRGSSDRPAELVSRTRAAELSKRAHLHLPDLPQLCSPGAVGPKGLPECFTPEQQPLDFVLQPPAASFTFNCSGSKIFSWDVSTHPETNLTVDSATYYSNFGVGLGGVVGNLDLTLITGAGGTAKGLLDRSVVVGTPGEKDGFVISWAVWGGDIPSQVKVEPGSTVGDFTLPLGSVGLLAPTVQLTDGQVVEGNGTLVLCVGCYMGNQVVVEPGAAMLLKYAVAEGAFNIQGTLVVSHSRKTASGSYSVPPGFGGQILEVELSAPANGTSVDGSGKGGVQVGGTVQGFGEGMQPLPSSHFPTAFVAQYQGCVTDASGNWEVVGLIQSPVSPGGSLLPGGWTPPCRSGGGGGSTASWWSVGVGFLDTDGVLMDRFLTGLPDASSVGVLGGFDPRSVALNASIDAVCVQVSC